MKAWHDDDGFWNTWAPVMFTRERFDNAPAETDQILKLLKVRPGASTRLRSSCGRFNCSTR